MHSDIWGPTPTPDRNGNRYYVSFTDDFSGYATIYLMKNKSEVAAHYLAYSRHIKNLNNGIGITFLRSDNGMEYKSKAFTSICLSDGTKQEFSAPYCQQENGTSERLNRTLLEKARCIMFESKCPLNLWGDAILTSCYLYNRTPQVKRGEAPYVLWFDKELSLTHIRIFGSLAYANVPLEVTSGKFNKRAVEGRMIGYSSEAKTYILWNERKRTQIDTRDVIFDESNHSFRSKPPLGQLHEVENAPSDIVDNEIITPTIPPKKDDDTDTETPGEQEDDSSSDNMTNSDDTESEISFDIESEYEEGHNEIDRSMQTAAEMNTQTEAIMTKQTGAPKISPVPVIKDVHESESSEEFESATESITSIQNEPPRRSTRASKPAKKFWEANLISSNNAVPETYKQALISPDAIKWKAAMNREGQSLCDAQSWTLVEKPEAGRKVIDGRWVFTKKLNADGSVNIHKARYVARGFSQVKDVDYKEIFSPVMKFTSLRTILAIASKEDWDIEQMDVTTAFLNGELEEDLYLKQPKGLEERGKETWVCKLRKSIYGLKQAPRIWNSTLDTFLRGLGFTVSDADSCVYIWKNGKDTVIVGVYVDDMVITGNERKNIDWIKDEFKKRFKMKDMGEAKFILGIEIERDREKRTMIMHQNAYATKKIAEFGMELLGNASTPLEVGLKLDTEESALLGEGNQYRQAVGSLIYLSNCTRPDLAFTVGVLSRYLCSPREIHWKAVQRVFQYLNQTKACGIEFKDIGKVELLGYSDSDYAGDVLTRKSTSGSINFLCSGPISWKSNRQRVVAKCTMEAEYIALSDNGSEVIWLRQLLSDLGYAQHATMIHEDNAACISIANNPTNHHRAKHSDIRYHWIRQEIQNGNIKLQQCPSKLMLADMMTKPLNRFLFRDLAMKCGITLSCLGGVLNNKQDHVNIHVTL